MFTAQDRSFSRALFAHDSAPNLTNATCPRGIALAGFLMSTFPEFESIFCFSEKSIFALSAAQDITYLGFAAFAPCTKSRAPNPMVPQALFQFLFFPFLLFFWQQKKTAPKWPRPGDEHFRDAVLARRHSRSAYFSGEKGGEKPSMRCFLSEKRRRL